MNREREIILAHRYLYYVECAPVLDDLDYDALERMLSPEDKEEIGVGSSLPSSYTPDIIKLAEHLQTCRRKTNWHRSCGQ